MGMAAPLLEGTESGVPYDVPAYVKSMPHVEFMPKNDGVFG